METSTHWFSLDDKKVRPAHESDIKKYFGGKECAYILYYRRKSLNRPAEAEGNPHYLMPRHVAEIIDERNSVLQAQRFVEIYRFVLITYCLLKTNFLLYAKISIVANFCHCVLNCT